MEPENKFEKWPSNEEFTKAVKSAHSRQLQLVATMSDEMLYEWFHELRSQYVAAQTIYDSRKVKVTSDLNQNRKSLKEQFRELVKQRKNAESLAETTKQAKTSGTSKQRMSKFERESNRLKDSLKSYGISESAIGDVFKSFASQIEDKKEGKKK